MKTIALASALAMLTCGSYAVGGALVPNKTVDISFDGYCDGMHLVINETQGLVTGNSTGCISAPLVGTVGGVSNLGAGIAVLPSDNCSPCLFVIDDNPKKWTIYATDGSIINSGTWSVGVPLTDAQVSRPSAMP